MENCLTAVTFWIMVRSWFECCLESVQALA